jgi:hypothetical protein
VLLRETKSSQQGRPRPLNDSKAQLNTQESQSDTQCNLQ